MLDLSNEDKKYLLKSYGKMYDYETGPRNLSLTPN